MVRFGDEGLGFSLWVVAWLRVGRLPRVLRVRQEWPKWVEAEAEEGH